MVHVSKYVASVPKQMWQKGISLKMHHLCIS